MVIPSCNCRGTLIEQIRAVCAQDTWVQFEVLVADNGSSDGTVEAVRAHIASQGLGQASHVEIVDASATRGSAHARNVGAVAASHEWLAFCDADDVVAPGWLDALLHVADPNGIVGGTLRVSRLNPPATIRARSSRPADSLNTAAGFLRSSPPAT